MSYNTNMSTITVDDVTYDVEEHSLDLGTRYTLQLDGEDVFEGLEGRCMYEEHIEQHDSPRDWCNVGKMAVSYRGYSLGDEDISKINFEVDCDQCDEHGQVPHPEREGETIDCGKCDGYCHVEVNPSEYFIKNEGARVVIGLFVYEHSGITMSAGPRVGEVIKEGDIRSTNRFIGDDAGWDTSFVGFTYDTPEQVKECIGDNATDEQIEAALRAEVAVYASYLEGDVTWFTVEDDETGFMESCGGFVGCQSECESECYAALESAIVKRLAEIKERAEWAARDTITAE
jgi:hypothetical protein